MENVVQIGLYFQRGLDTFSKGFEHGMGMVQSFQRDLNTIFKEMLDAIFFGV